MSSLQLAVLAAVHDMEDEIELSRTEAGLASPSSSEDNSLLVNEPSRVALYSEFVGETEHSVPPAGTIRQRSSCNGAHGGVMPSLPCLLRACACRALQVL